MEYKDYYKLLEVNKTATAEEIKKSFRKQVLKYHPDKNPGNKQAEERFKLINEANEVLSDPEKRKKYDELGENWADIERQGQQGGARRRGGGQTFQFEGDMFGGASESDFSEFFEQFFGQGAPGGQGRAGSARQPREFKGRDYETEMDISLEEAYHGASRIIQLGEEKLRITSKPGSYDGLVLKIKGKGAPGSSSNLRGDLYVRIQVEPHPQFTRKDDDLHITHTIDLYTAVLGGETVITTLSGQVKAKIAAGTQNGKIIRIKGKGMPVYGKAGSHGDLYVQLQVRIPEKLTDKQRELFEQLKSDQ